MADSATAQRDARRVKKNSKDLQEALGKMELQLNDMAGAASVWQGLGRIGQASRRERRNSRELEEELRQQFNEIDKDGSGGLDFDEIAVVLKKMDPNSSDEDVNKLLTWADVDGNGVIDFEEYKSIMTYKIAREGIMEKGVPVEGGPRAKLG